MSFKNKVVLITGGSAGIGAVTAELFAKEGAKVAIVGRNEEKLNAVAKSCQKYGANTLVIKADVSKDKEADGIVKKAVEKFGKLDVLVNNAGILRIARLLDENFLEIQDEVVNVNTRGPVRIVYFAAPHLIKTKGNIVNISSIAGQNVGVPGCTSYRTSKAALNHFTRSIALELAVHGVRVNSVSPGPVRTEIFEGLPINVDMMSENTALKKVSEPEEVGDVILFLASDKARSITGSDYVIDNGNLLRSN